MEPHRIRTMSEFRRELVVDIISSAFSDRTVALFQSMADPPFISYVWHVALRTHNDERVVACSQRSTVRAFVESIGEHRRATVITVHGMYWRYRHARTNGSVRWRVRCKRRSA